MVNRIQEILRRYNLSPSRFADELEVPRSTVSHILSERNKPSLEFIQKVLDHYPDINTNWLVKGEGAIFGKQSDLFSGLENPVQQQQLTNEQPSKDESPSNEPEKTIERTQVKPIGKYENIEKESREEIQTESPVKQDDRKEERTNTSAKKIIRIITFFDDNTFEEYLPSRRKDIN